MTSASIYEINNTDKIGHSWILFFDPLGRLCLLIEEVLTHAHAHTSTRQLVSCSQLRKALCVNILLGFIVFCFNYKDCVSFVFSTPF